MYGKGKGRDVAHGNNGIYGIGKGKDVAHGNNDTVEVKGEMLLMVMIAW